jgi:hypothetical protein
LPKNPIRLFVSAAAGFLIGLGVWWGFADPYTRVLAALSEPPIRLVERPAVTHLLPQESQIAVDRTDFPRASPRPALRTTDLTFNFILLTTLFAAAARPFADRNVRGFLLAAIALVAVHVAAVVANVQSIYALRLGPWSAAHYGPVARNFWAAAAHFYSVVGVYGAAVALWWLFRPVGEMAATRRQKGPRDLASSRAAAKN